LINKARYYFRLSNLEKHTLAGGILHLVGGDALCSLEDDSGIYASEGDSDLSIFLKSTHVEFASFSDFICIDVWSRYKYTSFQASFLVVIREMKM